MKFTPEFKARVVEALVAKLPDRRLGACSLCGTLKWTLVDAIVVTHTQEEFPKIVLGGQSLPSIALVCTNCGNTHLLNLLVLGLGDLLEKSEQEDSQKKEAASPNP